jgi:acetyl-CoA synthetase
MTRQPADRVDELMGVFADPAASAASLLCDRHRPNSLALTVIQPNMTATDVTFEQLTESSSRAARILRDLGVGPGDRVATLMGKSVDLVSLMLGIWRLGAVYTPLFTAFASQAISMRLDGSHTKVIVVDAEERPKMEPGPDMPANAEWQVVVAGELELHAEGGSVPHR